MSNKILKSTYTKSYKVNYFASATWRKIFLIKDNELHQAKEKYVTDRSSTIPSLFKGTKVKIYTGNVFHTRLLTKWVVGFKFGELTWNRKLALYKAKQLKKKKKK